MAVSIASTYTRREFSWTGWKAAYVLKGKPLQYEDDGSMYTIWTYDGPEVLICQIWKIPVPEGITASYSQIQNDSDKLDFETNFKPSGNTPLSQLDSDGTQIVRNKAAKRGWSFWSCPIEIVTSTIGASLYCEDRDGNSFPWVTAKIYDSFNVQITVPGLLNVNLNNSCKMEVDIEPPFNYELIGGSLRINSNPTQDVRLWIVAAPDIPANLGGSKEFASGVNLKFLSADNSWEVDGRVAKAISYDPVYHSGKLRLIVKHPPGLQVNIMFVMQLYRS